MIIVKCDWCGKWEEFTGSYIPDGWHFFSFDTIIHGEKQKHMCSQCFEEKKKVVKE